MDFSKIYGVGKKTAQKWKSLGYTTLDQINEPLTEKQKMGFKYYNDFLQPIPRKDIDLFKESLSKTNLSFDICGSYRRRKSFSSDIDVLVFSTDMNIVLSKFKKNKLIKDTSEVGERVCEGVTHKIGGFHRRIDIFLYFSKREYPFALLHFTGSKDFIISMSIRAESKGLLLNSKGLFLRNGTPTIFKIKTEKDIFDVLGITYLEPSERDIFLKENKAALIDTSSLQTNGTPNYLIRELILGYKHQILYVGEVDEGWLEENGFPKGKFYDPSEVLEIQFFLGKENKLNLKCPILLEEKGLISSLQLKQK
jgi:DNA polymerase/3'-5' exonuclease PolX